MKYISLFFCALVLPLLAQSQSTVLVKHFRYENGIALRWYPANLAQWQKLNASGYQVQRIALNTHKQADTSWLFEPGVGFDSSLFTDEFLLSHPKAAVVMQCLLPNPSATSVQGLLDELHAADDCMFWSMLLLQSDFELTLQLGLGFLDMGTDPNLGYKYVLYPKNLEFDTLSIYVPAHAQLDQLRAPKLAQSQNGIEISYSPLEWPDFCAGVYIQQSLDSGRSWKNTISQPIWKDISSTNITSKNLYLDAIPQKEGVVMYRFLPLNYFGDTLAAGKEATIVVENNTVFSPTFLTENQGCIHWQFPENGQNNISGFEIRMGADPEDVNATFLDTVVPAGSREYCPKVSGTGGYYFVVALYIQGHKMASLPVLIQAIDSYPPKQVVWQTAKIDSNGVVQLLWQSNAESDFYGYQLYRSNTRYNEFSNISHTWQTDTFFRDTLDIRWLRDSVYYYLIASDLRYNTSSPSAILALPIPDYSKPDVPLILYINLVGEIPQIHCLPSSAKNIMHYELYRKEKNDSFLRFKTIAIDGTDSFSIQDELALPGHEYSYQLRAKSRNQIHSAFSPEVSIVVPTNPLLPPVRGVRKWTDSVTQKTYITWYKTGYPVAHFRIIVKNENSMETLSTEKGDIFECVIPSNRLSSNSEIHVIAYDMEGRRSAW